MNSIDEVTNYAHGAVDKMANFSNQAVDAIDEKSGQLKNAEQQMMKNCQLYIRDNPVTSLGIAVAAGFLVSRLLSGR
jgi:ElaB/YqjD/DUF883 family membrane-anchored ribosome-binding protein